MKIDSTRFGSIEVEEDRLLHFARGLPGFPDCRRFLIMDHDRDTPLRWLVCADRPDVAFLVLEPEQIPVAYDIEIPEPLLAELGWKSRDDAHDVAIFLVLNVEERILYANLRAPVVVNVAERRALQLILDDPSIPLRHRI